MPLGNALPLAEIVHPSCLALQDEAPRLGKRAQLALSLSPPLFFVFLLLLESKLERRMQALF